MTRQLLWKTRLFAAIVVLGGSFGNLFLALGMDHSKPVGSPLDLLAAIFQPQVIVGILLLICWMLARMAMLSWADLSYVTPVTAIGYVVNALLGVWLHHEVITSSRWVGVVLITAGMMLVGGQDPHKHADAGTGTGAGTDPDAQPNGAATEVSAS